MVLFKFGGQCHCLTKLIFLHFTIPWIRVVWAHVTSDFFRIIFDFYFLPMKSYLAMWRVSKIFFKVHFLSFSLLSFHEQLCNLFANFVHSARFA